VPPRDGEGTPPGSDDELLAKVIPLRRLGEPVAPRVLAEEPCGAAAEGSEGPSAASEWSIWEPLPAELNWPERKPAVLRVLAEEPAGAGDPLVAGEWSIWDSVAPPLRRAGAGNAAPGARARAFRARRPDWLLSGVAAATATTIVLVSLGLGIGAWSGERGLSSLQAGSGLPASRLNTPVAPTRSGLQHRGSSAAAGGSRQKLRARHPGRGASKASRASSSGGSLETVRYVVPSVQRPTYTTTSAPAAQSAPPPREEPATAKATREFGFER
jgi:hypothetical protein